ncbi:ABC transporter permease [Frigoribacterium sp. Leaf172]|uniref:ABC transporter permease n=1 Tax=Frigoribacterium sp. Leaf172 TaxID=1736285 RepID=UPI000B1E2F71|nr:ABC transporter permease [Frigoribacterium sp. Leaf172]
MTTATAPRPSESPATPVRRSGPLAIAVAELRMLVRNRTVALCALLLPLAFGALTFAVGSYGTGGMLAGVQIIGMLGLGVYVTATTTLAARRQSLHLKRLRSGSVSDAGIIGGLVLPVVAVSLAQLVIVLGVLAIEEPPVNPGLLIVAVLVAEVMFAAFALATAGFSTSPEHAQYTTMPIYLITLGVAIWWTITGADDLLWLKRILPGGGLMELIVLAWNGGDLGLLPVLLAPTLLWAAVAVAGAVRFFRWEPRH